MVWEVTHTRNEPLDMRNYARAAYKYFNWHFDDLEKLLLGERTETPVTRAQVERRKRKLVVSGGIKV